MTLVGTFVFVAGMIGLFLLNRDWQNPSSKALWIPVLWLLIAGSRQVSMWLQSGPVMTPDRYMEGSPLDRAVYSTILFAGIIVVVTRRRAVVNLLKANWPVVLFVIYCAVSISWSDYPGVAVKRFIKSLGDYIMILIILTDRDKLRALKDVLAKVGFVLVPFSILLIKYYPELGRAYSKWDGTQYFVGVAQDKNMLGMTCLVFGLAAVWRCLHQLRTERNKRVFLIHGTVLAMTLWLFSIANSMTSLSCFVLASGLMAANSFLKLARKPAIVHFLVVMILLICAAPLFFGLGEGVLKTMGRDPTLTGRTEIWGKLLEVPINPVLGTGFESFWLGGRLESLWAIPWLKHINEAHDGYLETYLNLGWIGVFLVITVILTGYRNITKLLTRHPEPARLLLAYMVVGIAYNYTEAAIRTANPVWFVMLLAVMAAPNAVNDGLERSNPAPAEDKLAAHSLLMDHIDALDREFSNRRVTLGNPNTGAANLHPSSSRWLIE